MKYAVDERTSHNDAKLQLTHCRIRLALIIALGAWNYWLGQHRVLPQPNQKTETIRAMLY